MLTLAYWYLRVAATTIVTRFGHPSCVIASRGKQYSTVQYSTVQYSTPSTIHQYSQARGPQKALRDKASSCKTSGAIMSFHTHGGAVGRFVSTTSRPTPRPPLRVVLHSTYVTKRQGSAGLTRIISSSSRLAAAHTRRR